MNQINNRTTDISDRKKACMSISEAHAKLLERGFSKERIDDITRYLRGFITTMVRDALKKHDHFK